MRREEATRHGPRDCGLADATVKELFSATDGELDAFRAMEYDPLTKELTLKLKST